jgi:hypothetical protein
MKGRHWISLVASIRHGQSILILGPEIPITAESTDSQKEGATSFCGALTAELAAELEEDNRRVTGKALASVAQQYEDTDGFGANALRASAEHFYKSPRFTPSDVHTAIASFPFSLILTTCHDDLLIQALKKAGKHPVVYRYHMRGDKRDNPEFSAPFSPQSPLVFHLFGDARRPGSQVLSENDLLDFLIAVVSERPPLPNSLKRALKKAGQSFLFIGFGIKNWYLRVLLKMLVRSLELDRSGAAIATESLRELSQQDRERIVLFYQRGTRIEVEDMDIENFLNELSRRVEAEGGIANESIPAGPRPCVFISYASEDSEIAVRVFDALQKTGFEPWFDKDALAGGDLWDESIQDGLNNTDFTLVLYTQALCDKTDSYVNKEINLARQRASSVRGSFLIPLRTAEISDEQRIRELHDFQEMPLSPDSFDEDMAKVISTMRRDYQRRLR